MEVNVTKCQNGHYFDKNKHQVCPHCGAEIFTVAEPEKKKSGKGLFKKKVKEDKNNQEISMKTQNNQILIEDVPVTDTSKAVIIEDIPTEGDFRNINIGTEDDIPTEGAFDNGNNVEQEHSNKDAKEDEDMEDQNQNNTSLSGQIKKVTADNDTKTIGMFAVKGNKTNVNTFSGEPVVGWLVCLKGKNFGNEFRIVAGKNSIGRNNTNEISLIGEDSVSREKHAQIIYEPRKKEFFIKPGESSGLTYLNDDSIFETTKLKNNDILEFGDTKFLLVCLCGENFDWKNYIEK